MSEKSTSISNEMVNTGKVIAVFSFLIGTFILLLYFLTISLEIAISGYFFILIAGAANFICLIILFIRSRIDVANRRKLIVTCGYMLLNIPVVIVYIWFADIIANTLRVTFVNTTNDQLTNIKIHSYGEKQVNKLSPGQSKTVWLYIGGKSSVSIDYNYKGKDVKECVVAYTCELSGGMMEHKIGKPDQDCGNQMRSNF